ncbi:hypothetical protein JST97_04700 [bacterium]|nr:hypothetical protein [bacterium]
MTHKATPLSIRAIAIGFATDMFLTQLFVLALMIVLFDPGSSSECLAQRIDFHLLDLLGLSWGLLFTGLGGFVTGRLAPASRYSSAFMTGGLSLLTSLSINGEPSEWSYILGLALTVPAALAGAWASSRWRD